MDKRQEGILLSILTSATGISFFCNKNLLAYLNVETSSLLWFALGAVIYILFLLFFRRKHDLKMILKAFKKVLLVSVFSTIGALLWFQGMTIAQPANVAFIFQFERVIPALVGIAILGEKISSREGVGILLAFIGAFILTYIGGEAYLLNNLIIFASAVSYSMPYILAKVYVKDVSPVSLAAGRAMFTAGLLFVYTLALGRLEARIPIGAFSWDILGAFTAPFLAVLSQYEALKRIGISKSSAIASTQPFFTVLYAMLFFASFPSVEQMIGGGVTTLGVVLLTGSSSPQPQLEPKKKNHFYSSFRIGRKKD